MCGWFVDWKGMLDYVDDFSFMLVSGFDKIFGGKKNILERMRGDETAYVVAYLSVNIFELVNM